MPTRPAVVGAASHPSRRSSDRSGRTGGLLRRSPLRTARAAFTASSSSKPRGRLRCVVLFLTVARFPSCAAVKIRCRSRRTLSSWCRQSTASHEGRVLGSVHHLVSNLSFGSGAQGPLRFTGSPVHVSAPFEARAPGPVSSQLSSNNGLEEPFKVAGFLSAFARRHSLLGHPVPAREFRSPHSRPTDPPPGRPGLCRGSHVPHA